MWLIKHIEKKNSKLKKVVSRLKLAVPHWEIAYRRGAMGQLDSRLVIIIIWMIVPCSTSSQVYISFWLQPNYKANKPNIAEHLHSF